MLPSVPQHRVSLQVHVRDDGTAAVVPEVAGKAQKRKGVLAEAFGLGLLFRVTAPRVPSPTKEERKEGDGKDVHPGEQQGHGIPNYAK